MFFLKCKQFFKSPVLVLAAVLYFTWIIKKLLPGMISEEGSVADAMTFPLVFIPVSFVFFMFFSYALFSRESKSKVNEVILTCRNGKVRSYFCDLCLILAINAFLLLLFILYLGLQSGKALGSVQMDVLWFGIRCYLIHIILVNIFAALMGMAVSFIQNEIKAFAVMILLCCCFSQFFLESFYRLTGDDLDLQHMMDLFGLTTRMYHAAADYDYIFSIESVDLQRILFWIFLVLTILIYHLLQRKKRFFASCCGAAAVLLFVLYMLPNGASYININMNAENISDAYDEEDRYYTMHTEQAGRLEHHESEDDFKITKYVADIHVNRILKAYVEVYVDKPELETYTFSLRHEYRVTSVEDEYGEQVNYRQDGDWIALKPENTRKHSKFIFHYQGASKKFYSTSQAIRLPAYLAYLPFSGKRYLYLEFGQYNEEQDTILGLYNGSSLEGPGYKTEYDITVDSGLKLYSNLPEIAPNHFQGISNGATLMANTFLEEEEISGVKVVHSKINPGYFPKVKPDYDERKKWRTFIAENDLQGKTIFALGVVHGSEDSYRYFGEDHLVLMAPCTDQYQTYLKTGKHPYYEELAEEEILKDLEALNSITE